MKKIKIGLVGLSPFGELHVKHLKTKISGAELIAVCSNTAARVEEIQAKYDVPYGYTDYMEMIKNPELDAVMIITNVSAHKEQCIAAAKAGLHIFCEKPLATTIEECREIEKAVEANKGKIFTIGFMRRSDPAYDDAMEKVRAGVIGDPIIFKSVALDPHTVLESHIANVRIGRYKPFFLEMGIHDLDLALWYLNSEMESVYAIGGAYVEPEFAKYNDYDNACALAKFKNGTCAYIQVGRSHNSCHVHSEIIGTKGTIRINNVPRKGRVEIFNDEGIIEECEETFLDRWVDAYVAEIEDFVACINGEKTPKISVYDGAKSLKMYNMVQKSYVENRLVTCDEFDD